MSLRQPELIQPEHLSPRLHWEKLFSFLPPWPEPPSVRGRRPVSRDALLKACIFQRLTRHRFLTDLHSHLQESAPIRSALGFDSYQPPPPLERFSAFLGDTPHDLFEWIRLDLTVQLLDAGVISGDHVGFDSCPIISWVRENNLKTGLRHRRFDKQIPPKADPDARLGVRIHYPNPEGRKIDDFWGYRHHVLVDLQSELPLWEITEPCNVSEMVLAIPLLDATAITFGLTYKSVCGDAGYDADSILRHIQQAHRARAYIPYNPTHLPDQNGYRRHHLQVFCPANLQMHRHGAMNVKGRTYVQYRCPFFDGPRPKLLMCPVDHPKFSRQKGGNYLWRTTDNPRNQIPYGTDEFKLHYNRRTAVERVFSRMLAIALEEPAVRGARSIRNHCTISTIAVLLVVLAAHNLGCPDKIRFVRTFMPSILADQA